LEEFGGNTDEKFFPLDNSYLFLKFRASKHL